MSLFFQIELDYLAMVPCSNLQPHQKTFICYFHSNAVIHRDLTGVIFVFLTLLVSCELLWSHPLIGKTILPSVLAICPTLFLDQEHSSE